jgi:hypothetical protein
MGELDRRFVALMRRMGAAGEFVLSAVYPVRNALHLAAEWRRRRPDAAFLRALGERCTPEVERVAARLDADGICVLPGYVAEPMLARLRDGFERMMEHARRCPVPDPRRRYLQDHFHDPEAELSATNQPYLVEPGFLNLACDPFLLAVTGRYLGRPFILHQASGLRITSTRPRDFGSFQWHHDAWGKKLTAHVLLTDVPPGGQCTTYLKGSHRLYHSLHRTRFSRFPAEEVRRHLRLFEPMDAVAPAGSIVLLDPNGVHRGNRRPGPVRDTVLNLYSTGIYPWPLRIPAEFAEGLDFFQRAVLAGNPLLKFVPAEEAALTV